jgi:putative two-component system response regulator
VETNPRAERILIVDDSSSALQYLEDILRGRGYAVFAFTRGKQALIWARENTPDLVLLDIQMPDMDGFEICGHLKKDRRLHDVPVIFISMKHEAGTKITAFGLGCVDYITKPFEAGEVITRVQTHLKLRRMQAVLENHNHELERIVKEKTQEITDSWTATILALAKLAESRDDDTGNHLDRIQVLCWLLAENLAEFPGYRTEINREFIHTIYHASPLHDIGKVGIPDRILLKPGRLDPDEFEIMKRHTLIGAQTLETVQTRYRNNMLIHAGVDIARSHHERWDGTGYPDGIAGNNIPLCARIAAVADVYDALRSTRCYKKAIMHEQAVSIIRKGKGTQFDPDIVEVFLAIERYLLQTNMYQDEELIAPRP